MQLDNCTVEVEPKVSAGHGYAVGKRSALDLALLLRLA